MYISQKKISQSKLSYVKHLAFKLKTNLIVLKLLHITESSNCALPKTTFSIQVLAPSFVVLEKLLHHFCQGSIIQLRNKRLKHTSILDEDERVIANYDCKYKKYSPLTHDKFKNFMHIANVLQKKLPHVSIYIYFRKIVIIRIQQH